MTEQRKNAASESNMRKSSRKSIAGVLGTLPSTDSRNTVAGGLAASLDSVRSVHKSGTARQRKDRDCLGRNILLEGKLLTGDDGRFLPDVRELEQFELKYRSLHVAPKDVASVVEATSAGVFSRLRAVSARVSAGTKERVQKKAVRKRWQKATAVTKVFAAFKDEPAGPPPEPNLAGPPPEPNLEEKTYYEKFEGFQGVFCTDPKMDITKLLPVPKCDPPAAFCLFTLDSWYCDICRARVTISGVYLQTVLVS